MRGWWDDGIGLTAASGATVIGGGAGGGGGGGGGGREDNHFFLSYPDDIISLAPLSSPWRGFIWSSQFMGEEAEVLRGGSHGQGHKAIS